MAIEDSQRLSQFLRVSADALAEAERRGADLARALAVAATAVDRSGGSPFPSLIIEGYRSALVAGRINEVSALFERAILPHVGEMTVYGPEAVHAALMGLIRRDRDRGFHGTAFASPMVLGGGWDTVSRMVAELRVVAAIIGGYAQGHAARVLVLELAPGQFVLARDSELFSLVMERACRPADIELVVHSILFERITDGAVIRDALESHVSAYAVGA